MPNWRRTRAVARKEVFHILRDPFTLLLALAWPVSVVLIFGFAMDFNIKNIPMGVYDADRTQASRSLIDTFGSSNYFLIAEVGSPQLAIRRIQGEQARAALVISPQFQRDLLSGAQGRASAQILLDGSDNSTIGPMTGYIAAIQSRASYKLVGRLLGGPVGQLAFDPPSDTAPPPALRTRFLFNPELNSRWFTVPGLAVVVMSILSILLTSLTVAREWENGSMELLLSTPVEPMEIILGKLTPYGVLGLSAVGIVYVVARVVFDVPFAGSHLVFLLGSLIFLTTYLAQGLLISVITRRQMLAMQIAMISGLLPAQLLSGFVFPIESMPVFFRYFTAILPARWFMVIARSQFLQGSPIWELKTPFLALCAIAFVMIRIATRKFKKDLE